MLDKFDSNLTPDPPASLTHVTPSSDRPISPSSIPERTEKFVHRTRLIDLNFKTKLNVRECILIILLIISTILVLLAALRPMKHSFKPAHCNMTKTRGKLLAV
jgi:hypothetical protein